MRALRAQLGALRALPHTCGEEGVVFATCCTFTFSTFSSLDIPRAINLPSARRRVRILASNGPPLSHEKSPHKRTPPGPPSESGVQEGVATKLQVSSASSCCDDRVCRGLGTLLLGQFLLSEPWSAALLQHIRRDNHVPIAKMKQRVRSWRWQPPRT